MEDPESYFLRAIGAMKRDIGELPDFMVKGEPPDKIRLVFKSKIEPPITFGDWTVITVSPKDFGTLSQMYPGIMADYRKK